MFKRMTSMLLVGAVALSMLAACQRDADSTSSSSAQVEAAVESSAATVNGIANIAQNTAASAAVAVPTVSVLGEDLLTFAPSKTFQSIAFSSPALEQSDTIEVYYGGSATGAAVGGVYLDGAYTPGDQIASFTVSNVVTQVGSSDR